MATSLAAPEEEIVHLERYVNAIRRHWRLIFAGAVLGSVLAFWHVSRQPLRYQGVTTLLVVPPIWPDGPQINPATFRAIVQNGTLAAQVIEELNLEDQLNPRSFVESALSAEEVRGTQMVRVTVTLPNPEMAAEASRRLTQKAILLAQQIDQQKGAAIQDQLKSLLSDAYDRLGNAEKALLTYKQDAGVDVMKDDTAAQLREFGALLPLALNIESERARMSVAETEIKRQERLLSVGRGPAAEEVLQRAQSASASEVMLRPVGLTRPVVNPVYQTLHFQIATSRTRIAALEELRDAVIGRMKLSAKESSRMNELYGPQIALARLQGAFDLAAKVYDDLSIQYGRFASAAQLQIVDNALPPDRPISRKRLQYGLFGAGIGFAAMLLLTLIRESRTRRSGPNAA